MYIIATFPYGTSLELALSELHTKGVSKNEIMVIPLDKKNSDVPLFDTIHHTDGRSFVDLAGVFGVIFMLLGVIYGTVLYLGPILWGLFGLIFGLLLGYMLDVFSTKQKNKRKKLRDAGDAVVLIISKNVSYESIEHICWTHSALGVGRLSTEENANNTWQ
ncbi:hypothetical protein GJU40_09045 [Bacillus lacus]|uniref:Uncharacterized protein n=1 Tax=Metabacillus lacus TaxID=1983721 RepID=A0A7X2IZE9_9BACI|nr:hypothetical protein [Metabacillus lacus]MRX72297.1 hypothetical protein [Metabacillus lacus]